MNAFTIHRLPWTCRFGRLGGAVEALGPETSRVDNVFWACCLSAGGPAPRLTTRGQCEKCPFWEASARFD